MLSQYFTIADSAVVNIRTPVFFHNYGNILVGMRHSSGTPKGSIHLILHFNKYRCEKLT